MACENACCPPHNFNATEDPTVNDCNNSTVSGYSGGYCPGSYWYNKTTGVMWIGANDMGCGSALWLNLNPPKKIVLASYAEPPNNTVYEYPIPDEITEPNGLSFYYPRLTQVTIDNHSIVNGGKAIIPRSGYYSLSNYTIFNSGLASQELLDYCRQNGQHNHYGWGGYNETNGDRYTCSHIDLGIYDIRGDWGWLVGDRIIKLNKDDVVVPYTYVQYDKVLRDGISQFNSSYKFKFVGAQFFLREIEGL